LKSKTRLEFLLGYTYSKSIDQGSNLGEQLDPLDLRATRAILAWDMKHRCGELQAESAV
jgi:hypothetical protein